MAYIEILPSPPWDYATFPVKTWSQTFDVKPRITTGQMFPHTKDVNIQPVGWVEPFAYRNTVKTGQIFPRGNN